MVVHSLQQVAHQLRVEKRHGKSQKFYEEVAHQRDVYPHADVKQKPAADEVSGSASRHYQQLSKKDEPDEAYVAMPYADIDDGLGEKRQDELEQASQQQTNEYLYEIFSIL